MIENSCWELSDYELYEGLNDFLSEAFQKISTSQIEDRLQETMFKNRTLLYKKKMSSGWEHCITVMRYAIISQSIY